MAKRPFTSDDAGPIQAAIGDFMMAFNLAESLLDILVAISYHEAGGNKIEPEIPFKLSRKLKFAGKAFRRLKPLAPYQGRGEDFLSVVSQARGTRDTLAHGHITKITDEGAILHFGVFRLSDDKKIQIHSIADLSLHKILADAGECHRIARETIPLVNEMLECVVSDNRPKKLLG
jgi:hypothetical protein